MADVATIDDKRFVFLKDIDGNDAPIFVGSVVKAILSGAIPGFTALNQKETEFVDSVIADAEHHHRFEMMHSPNAAKNWRHEADIERKFRSVRTRLNLPVHHEIPSHCSYLKYRNGRNEAVGL